jgi:hypothetical protein
MVTVLIEVAAAIFSTLFAFILLSQVTRLWIESRIPRDG